jgi:hypothetical protein
MGAFDNLRGDQIDHGCESLLIYSARSSSVILSSRTPIDRPTYTISYTLVPLPPSFQYPFLLTLPL